MKKKVPPLKTDREAEAFLAQDLSNLDFSQFKPARFEFEKKDEQINMRSNRPSWRRSRERPRLARKKTRANLGHPADTTGKGH